MAEKEQEAAAGAAAFQTAIRYSNYFDLWNTQNGLLDFIYSEIQ